MKQFLIPLALVAASATHAQIVIQAIYGSNITSNPNAAAIESTIQEAINIYQGIITTPVTVKIIFNGDDAGSLGSSSTFVSTYIYEQFRADLVTHADSANDTLALAHLPNTINNPVNGSDQIALTLPLLRALGEHALGDNGGFPDANITFNLALMNISRTGPQDLSKYDLLGVAMHEIDEVLGFGSALNGLQNGDAAPTGAIRPLDLFRYDQNGLRSFTTDVNAAAYFSIDGTTRLVRFNQTQGGDFMDFYGDAPHHVQDAFATPGVQYHLATAELTGLDVIGWNGNFTPVPEPETYAVIFSTALAGFALWRRRR